MRYDVFGKEGYMHIVHEVKQAGLITVPELVKRLSTNLNHTYEMVKRLEQLGVLDVNRVHKPHAVSVSSKYNDMKAQFIMGLP